MYGQLSRFLHDGLSLWRIFKFKDECDYNKEKIGGFAVETMS